MLCRKCGHSIARTRDIKNILAKSSYKFSLKTFPDGSTALVQLLSNSFVSMEVITVSKASLATNKQVYIEAYRYLKQFLANSSLKVNKDIFLSLSKYF